MTVDCRDCKHIRIVDIVRDKKGETMPIYQCQKGICSQGICDGYEWKGG